MEGEDGYKGTTCILRVCLFGLIWNLGRCLLVSFYFYFFPLCFCPNGGRERRGCIRFLWSLVLGFWNGLVCSLAASLVRVFTSSLRLLSCFTHCFLSRSVRQSLYLCLSLPFSPCGNCSRSFLPWYPEYISLVGYGVRSHQVLSSVREESTCQERFRTGWR